MDTKPKSITAEDTVAGPQRPLTLQQIQDDPDLEKELVDLALRRWQVSQDWCEPKFAAAVRFFKIWRSWIDATDDEDEPNSMPSYAFGVIEDITSKLAEPILRMKPPVKVQPKKAIHEEKARNWESRCAAQYQDARFQIEYTTSCRVQAIAGWVWERDGWANDWIQGKRWGKVQKVKMVDTVIQLVKGIFKKQTPVPYESTEEIDQLYPKRVGITTEFPSIFDVFPEPGVKKVEDMHWILEQHRRAAVSDLLQTKYKDEDGEIKTVYNFDKLYQDSGSSYRPGTTQPDQVMLKHDYGQEVRDIDMGGSDTSGQTAIIEDRDFVHLLEVWEQDRWYVIGQGRRIVAYQEFPYHQPRLPYRCRVYTDDPESMFGIGAIEPIESDIYELKDIHVLSMRNWLRIVNRMVAVHMDNVPFEDDFKPRAGGRIRVRNAVRVQDSIMPIEMPDATGSMLAQESNTKAAIERALSITDWQAGSRGTRMNHKTAAGLMEVSRNLAERMSTIRRLNLACCQDQMKFWESLYLQFGWEKEPVSLSRPDGSFHLTEMNRDDIDTEGVGFKYVIENDPTQGDDAALRNMLMVLFNLTMKYEQFRMTSKDPELPKADMGDIMRRMFLSFGWQDTSRVLQSSKGKLLTPQMEMQLMEQGQPTAPQQGEDLLGHLVDHMGQRQDPQLLKAVQEGKVPAKVLMLLDAHIQATMQAIQKTAQNAGQIAQQKKSMEMRQQVLTSGVPESPQQDPDKVTADA